MQAEPDTLELTRADIDITPTDNIHEDTTGIIDTLETLHDNGVHNTELLRAVGRRMHALRVHGDLTPSNAKVLAVDELVRGGKTIHDTAQLLDITKGGYSKLKNEAQTTVTYGHALVTMTGSVPSNIIHSDTNLAPDGDTENEYFLLERATTDTDEPRYAMVTITDDGGTTTPPIDIRREWFTDADDLLDKWVLSDDPDVEQAWIDFFETAGLV